MEAKHTPGPWNIVESNKIDEEAHIQTDLKSICRMWIQMDSQDMANARLIAAAPELLEALKEIAELNTMYPPNYNTMTESQKCEWTHYGKFAVIARAAIAKATGE